MSSAGARLANRIEARYGVAVTWKEAARITGRDRLTLQDRARKALAKVLEEERDHKPNRRLIAAAMANGGIQFPINTPAGPVWVWMGFDADAGKHMVRVRVEGK